MINSPGLARCPVLVPGNSGCRPADTQSHVHLQSHHPLVPAKRLEMDGLMGVLPWISRSSKGEPEGALGAAEMALPCPVPSGGPVNIEPRHYGTSPRLVTAPRHRASSPRLVTAPRHRASSPRLVTASRHRASSPRLVTAPRHRASSPLVGAMVCPKVSIPTMNVFKALSELFRSGRMLKLGS
ncbi:unnamed protein product [Arctogadus glacialis]